MWRTLVVAVGLVAALSAQTPRTAVAAWDWEPIHSIATFELDVDGVVVPCAFDGVVGTQGRCRATVNGTPTVVRLRAVTKAGAGEWSGPGEPGGAPGTFVVDFHQEAPPLALTDQLETFLEFESGAETDDSHGSNNLTDNNGVGNVAGKVGNAADFTTANTEWYSIAHNSSVNVGGNTSFSWAGGVYLKDKDANYSIVVKMTGSDGEYRLDYRAGGTDRFRFVCYGSSGFGSAAGINADTLGSPSTATWYFIIVRHDATNDLISIQVDNGTEDSTAFAAGIFAGSADVMLGGDNALGQYGNIRLDQWGYWKGRVLTSQDGTDLYNGGNWLSYAALSGGGGGGQPMARRFGGVPHAGTVKLRGGHRGGPWGRTRSGVLIPRWLEEAA